MTDRIASDHDAVSARRARVSTVGRTGRVQVELPDGLSVDAGDVIWCALEGDAGYARVAESLAGTLVIRRVRANRRHAREDDGPDRLADWLEEAAIDSGDALHLDVLTEGHAYGLRPPGMRVVYAPPDPPDRSLADIARDLTEDQ